MLFTAGTTNNNLQITPLCCHDQIKQPIALVTFTTWDYPTLALNHGRQVTAKWVPIQDLLQIRRNLRRRFWNL